ncbi:MAG: HAD family hydrolase [Pedobacter sp.]|nr:MAG: HAD family hydrolase [Pedobacter sp.]
METAQYLHKYNSFIFEFDDVLYPEKDYFLQVYYLFAQFIEYAEQRDATELLAFMKSDFDSHGHEGIFDRTMFHFNLDEKYRVNFDLLMQNVKLPLKLLLFDGLMRFLQSIAEAGKQIFLMLSGDPVMQLNKIRQTEWNGLEVHLIVYFTEEFGEQSTEANLFTIMGKHGAKAIETLFVGHPSQAILINPSSGINYLEANKLLA